MRGSARSFRVFRSCRSRQLTRPLRTRPSHVFLRFDDGTTRINIETLQRKDFEKAAKQYEAALRLDPRLPAAWYNNGNDLLRHGRARRAVRLFSKSLRCYPTDVWALNNRGLAYVKMGKPEKAWRDFESVLGIDQQFAPARRNPESLRDELAPP